ncbi:hypothetical protein [Wolbachia endosymbiont (group B) of Ablattaria laevigata]|uniref:hypothetical protein n=1 Tax=Wolbachia endosymbiont (group B) of Ablattaria laevigata TaxID=3077915 RepID=UPI00376EAEFC
MVYNYSNLPKLPFTAYNLPAALPVSNYAQACTPPMAYNLPAALPVPVSNCAQACTPQFVPCATNSCHNYFNSHHNYYDTCHNPCDGFGFFY